MTVLEGRHINSLLLELRSMLGHIKKHQLRISDAQCKSMDELVKVVSQLVKKQEKVLEEVLLGNRVRQLHYEATLNILAEQQQKMLGVLEKTMEESFVNVK